MNNFCLGISGQKQSGKDTLCSIIINKLEAELNINFYQRAFADNVKNILCLFHYIDENNNQKKVTKDFIEKNKNNNYIPKNWNMTIRESLVNIGDRLREICPNVWADLIVNNNDNKVITDIRYYNEAKIILNNPKGLVIRVIRDSVIQKNGNSSEIELLKYDNMIQSKEYEGEIDNNNIPYNYIIRNNSNLEEFKNKINTKLLPFILKKWKYFL